MLNLHGRESLVASALLALLLAHGLASEQAERTDVTGSSAGLPSSAVPLEGLWKLGGNSEAPEELFGVIVDVVVDGGGRTYLLDLQLAEVKVFSPSGEYLRTIGSKGEGPGEFQTPRNLFITDDERLCVLQPSPARMSLFELDGRYVGELELPDTDHEGVRTVTHARQRAGTLVLQGVDANLGDGFMEQASWVGALDPVGDRIVTLAESRRRIDLLSPVVREVETNALKWALGPTGEIYLNQSFDYKFTVKSADGEIVGEVARSYEHRKRSQREVEEIHSYYANTNGSQGVQFEIMQYNRDVEWFGVTSDGMLWVLTSRGMDASANEGVLGAFDLFDRTGKLAREVTLLAEGDLRSDRCYFENDRIYVVTHFDDAFNSWRLQTGARESPTGDDDDLADEVEPMAIICYRMPGGF